MSDDPTSPVKDVHYNTLDELFSRDPLSLADKDIDVIVAELRRRREKWLIDSEAPKPDKKVPRPKMTSQEADDLLKGIL